MKRLSVALIGFGVLLSGCADGAQNRNDYEVCVIEETEYLARISNYNNPQAQAEKRCRYNLEKKFVWD